MCTNSRWIYNKYSGKHVFVSCGHCESCLQEKANFRTRRIRNNYTPGKIALFVTLTYSPDYLPYVLKDDLFSARSFVPVYRSCSVRFYGSSKKIERLPKIIGNVPLCNEDLPRSFSEIRSLKSAKGSPSGYVGVCFMPDIQNFFKRLRINLLRHYNYEKKFTYWVCSEYGPSSHRPHFHALVFIPSDDESLFRRAICESWPFALYSRTEKYIEIAKDAAGYVASYLSGSTRLPSLLQTSYFKQKHCCSKFFGVGLDCFSLRSLLSALDRRDLHYYCKVSKAGESSVIPLSVPQYVVNRYFPLFKGFGRFTSSELFGLLLKPEFFGYKFNDSEVKHNLYTSTHRYELTYYRRNILDYWYQFSKLESYRFYVRLKNAYDYFHSVTGFSYIDYVICYINIWNLFYSTHIIDQYKDIKDISDFHEFYYNLSDYDIEFVSPTLSTLSFTDVDYLPNRFRKTVIKTNNLTDLFYKKDKSRRVNNSIYSLNHFL